MVAEICHDHKKKVDTSEWGDDDLWVLAKEIKREKGRNEKSKSTNDLYSLLLLFDGENIPPTVPSLHLRCESLNVLIKTTVN